MNKSTFTNLVFALFISAVVGLPIAGAQTETVNEKYRVVLKLNSESLSSLRNTGFVKAEIPKSQRDKVVGVKIVKLSGFINEPIKLEANTSVSRGVLRIKITNAMMDQLEFRPVLIKVTEKGFTKVLLDYSTANTNRAADEATASQTPQINAKNRFFVRRDEKNGIAASIPEASTLSVKTDYGTYEIPWSEIEAVHIDVVQNVSVILRNGDKMSGKLNQNKFKLLTVWGDHEIPAARLYSFTRTEQQKFLATNSMSGVKFLLYDFSRNRRSVGY